jgi:hypothetical protein
MGTKWEDDLQLESLDALVSFLMEDRKLLVC